MFADSHLENRKGEGKVEGGRAVFSQICVKKNKQTKHALYRPTPSSLKTIVYYRTPLQMRSGELTPIFNMWSESWSMPSLWSGFVTGAEDVWH